jgi:hypothetical protein
MGKPSLNGCSTSILVISIYNVVHALCAASPPWPKDPLRMKLKEEIWRGGVMGRLIGLKFYFPFPILLSPILFLILI